MNSKNLGNLPSEIIQEIWKHLKDFDYNQIPHRLKYQLINKHWYLASLQIACRVLVLNSSLEDYERFSELEGFFSLLQNPAINVGQYIKEIHLETGSRARFSSIALISRNYYLTRKKLVKLNGIIYWKFNKIMAVRNFGERCKLYTLMVTLKIHFTAFAPIL